MTFCLVLEFWIFFGLLPPRQTGEAMAVRSTSVEKRRGLRGCAGADWVVPVLTTLPGS